MGTLPESSGAYLRRMRKARRLTLRQVEECSHLSTSVLSRLERSERRVSREDCLILSKCLHLTSYETYSLFFMAGYLPETQRAHSDLAVRSVALGMLQEFRFPAILIDKAGYLHAWNAIIENVWRPSHVDAVHVLDDLFSERARTQLRDQWRSWARRAIWLFLQRSVSSANEQAYAATVNHLEARHGAEMKQLLAEAHTLHAPDATDMNDLSLLFAHETPHGLIRYVNAQVLLHSNSGLELHMHLPVDAGNMRRFEAWTTTLGPNAVFLGRPPGSNPAEVAAAGN